MTLKEIKLAIAIYLNETVTKLTVHGQDLGLQALNQVRLNAEQNNDFNFTRKLLQVTVDGVTGGSLDTAIEYGDVSEDPVVYDIKTIVDVGTFDTSGNFRPSEWSTVSDSLNRERMDNPLFTPRYPTDAEAICGPIGQRRFVFSGGKVYFFPRTADFTVTLGLEAYTFTPDWTTADIDPGEDDVPYNGVWNKQGSQYLQWKSIVHINQLYKQFVFRQEGNLPPPQALVDEGLDNLIRWDNFKYEQYRRHSR